MDWERVKEAARQRWPNFSEDSLIIWVDPPEGSVSGGLASEEQVNVDLEPLAGLGEGIYWGYSVELDTLVVWQKD